MARQPTLRVVIPEDHYLVREGTRRTLEDGEGILVVATVGTALELEDVAARERPDVMVTDIRMPPENRTDGIDAIRRIRITQPAIGAVVLSQYADATYAMDLFRDGTAGLTYLLKEQVGDPDQLLTAVHTVADGRSWVDPGVVAAMVAHSTRQESSALRDLTHREMQVLEQMAQGRTNAAIADNLRCRSRPSRSTRRRCS